MVAKMHNSTKSKNDSRLCIFTVSKKTNLDLAVDGFPDVFDFVDDGLVCGLFDDVGHVDATLVHAERKNKLTPELIL